MKSLLLLVLLAIPLFGGCGGIRSSDDRREVVVSAAASLTDAFLEMESVFEDAHPDVDVIINLGGSSALREQILAGAPVDVFASANPANMTIVIEEGVAAGPAAIFAVNQLAIAVPVANPGGIVGLEDFANPDLLIGLCAPAVPCGDFARQVLSRAGIEPVPDTNEPDVRALLTKIETGELDVGIVYATDVVARGGDVVGVEIPQEFNVAAEYPIAVLTGGENLEDGTAFAAFVLSAAGQAILVEHGFATP